MENPHENIVSPKNSHMAQIIDNVISMDMDFKFTILAENLVRGFESTKKSRYVNFHNFTWSNVTRAAFQRNVVLFVNQ